MKKLFAVLLLAFVGFIYAGDSLNVADTIIPSYQPPVVPACTTLKSMEGATTIYGWACKDTVTKVIIRMGGTNHSLITYRPSKRLGPNKVWGIMITPSFFPIDTTVTHY